MGMAKLFLQMGLSTKEASRKTYLKVKENMNGLMGMSMKEAGKTLTWKEKVSLDMLMAENTRELSGETTS